MKWEQLKIDQGIVLYRARVPGGWLVATYMVEGSGLTFYPGPHHEWDGTSK
jgi:hypothetical protein